MPQPTVTSTLRVLHPNGESVGTGFLVTAKLAVTCAHVVVTAEALDGDTIQVQFTGHDQKISALVEPAYWREVAKGDVAFLRLDTVPEGIQPLRLAPAGTAIHRSDFRSFGYTSAAGIQGIHVNGTIDGYLPEHRLLQLQSPQANHGVSGGPVWDNARGVVVGMITKGHTELGRNQETTFATPAELLFEICPEIKPSETCPYLGLETFTAENARFFFGRESLTEKLVSTLRSGCRFLAIFGPSGSGKSSVVRAGLLPKLENGLFSGWRQVVIRPADQPFEQLKVTELEAVENTKEKIILFIDQFEELFTLCPDDLREKFVNDLATRLDNPRFLLIISMRDDFYSAFNAKAAPLATSEHLKIENVPGTLKREDLTRMIDNPAQVAGLALEEGLIERILEDLLQNDEARSSSLPLLEFGLTQLWEKRRDGLLTHDAYDSIGGVTGSLARWADEAFSDLTKDHQALAAALLTALIHLGDEAQGLPDTRRRRSLVEFDAPAQRVIKHFVDRRLLITDRETVELVHDALVREWGHLQNLIGQDRDNLRLRESVSENSRSWDSANRDESLLNHRGPRLELALAMSKNTRYLLNPVEQAYLNECVRLKEREIKSRETLRRRIITGLSTGLAIALVLTGFAIFQMQQAQKQSQIALARLMNIEAQPLFANGNSEQMVSVLLAIQSMRMYPNREIAQILQNNTLSHPISHMTHNSPVTSVAFSPDGKYVVSGSDDNTARIWEVSQGKEINSLTHFDLVSSVLFSPDGKYIASASYDKTARVWDASTGKEIARMTHDDLVISIAFSPDGKNVVSGSDDNTARVWETETGKEIARMTHDDRVNCVAFSPNGKYVVSGSNDRTARVWEISSGKEIVHMVHDGPVVSATFSPDGKHVATGSYDGTARIWEISSGREILHIKQDVSISSVVFSADGEYVGLAGGNNIWVWAVDTGEEIALMAHNGWVNSIAFSPDGKYVVSGSNDSTARVWEISSGREISRITQDVNVSSVAFSLDGKYVVSGSGCGWANNCIQGSVYIWDPGIDKNVFSKDIDAQLIDVYELLGKKFAIWRSSDFSDGIIHIDDAITGKNIIDTVFDEQKIEVYRNDKYVIYRNNAGGGGQVDRIEFSEGDIVLDSVNTNEWVHLTQRGRVNTVAFSLDGNYLASGGDNNAVFVWEISTGNKITQMLHDGKVNSVAFSPDGKYVVSGSDDSTTRIWETITGKEIARMTSKYAVTFVKIIPDNIVISGGCSKWDSQKRICVDIFTRMWLYRTDDLIIDSCSRVTRNLTRAEWQKYIGDALSYKAICPNLPIEPETPLTP
jgi:WD40 repeat protein